MATHPSYADHHHAESDSGAFFKAAAVLLGIAVGIVGFFALMLWANAKEATSDANASAAAAQPMDHMVDKRLRCRMWTREHGEDEPSVRDWVWPY